MDRKKRIDAQNTEVLLQPSMRFQNENKSTLPAGLRGLALDPWSVVWR